MRETGAATPSPKLVRLLVRSRVKLVGMGLHPPIVHCLPPPPGAEELARRARVDAEFAQQRAEREARAAALLPLRRVMLEDIDGLRDVDAALACWCACHPRPADPTMRGGGLSCRCQLTDEARAAALAELLALPDDLLEEEEAYRARRDAEFAAAATRLGVTAHITIDAAPLVILGEVDGRAFKFRERGEQWRVQIRQDDDPLGDPEEWEHSITIASGDADEVWVDNQLRHTAALRVSVNAVRQALCRNACLHEVPRDAEHQYCSLCGVPLADAAAWRWTT